MSLARSARSLNARQQFKTRRTVAKCVGRDGRYAGERAKPLERDALERFAASVVFPERRSGTYNGKDLRDVIKRDARDCVKRDGKKAKHRRCALHHRALVDIGCGVAQRGETIARAEHRDEQGAHPLAR